MSVKKFVNKVAPDAIDLFVDVASHLINSRPVKGPVEDSYEEEIPISGEELDRIAEVEFGGYVPDFDSQEEAEDFNAKLIEDVEQKTDKIRRIEAGEDYGHEAKSFEGQSDVDYCIECAVKHSQTVSMLMTEALQRAEVGDPGLLGVQEKVRGAVRELTGLEDDTETVKNPAVMALNTMARALRKHIYTSKAEIGGASMEDVRDIKDLSEKLVNASYLAREAEDCPTCNVESS